MKKRMKSIFWACMMLLCASVFVVPNALCSIQDCMAAKGIDMATADKAEIKAAMKACAEEARAEKEAAMAEKKAEMEAKIAEMEAKIAEKMAEVEAKIAEKRAVHDAIEACMTEAQIDPETATPEEVMAQLEQCAAEAGVDVEGIKAKITEMEAMKAEMEAKIAECKAKKAAVHECIAEAMEGVEPGEMDKAGFKTIVNDCLLEIGIDVEAIRAEMEARMAEKKAAAEAVKACIEATDFSEMDAATARAAIEACLAEAGIDLP